MEALIDNDVIIAIARYGLVTEFDTITRGKCTRPHRCVPAARTTLRLYKEPRWERYPSDTARNNARSFFAACKPLDGKPLNLTRFSSLLRVPEIHEGEAYLFDYACENPDAIVITGDKNSTKALAASEDMADIVSCLKGRIVHLECLVDSMIGRFGFNVISPRILSDRKADKTLTRLFDDKQHETTVKASFSLHLQMLEADLSEMLRLPL